MEISTESPTRIPPATQALRLHRLGRWAHQSTVHSTLVARSSLDCLCKRPRFLILIELKSSIFVCFLLSTQCFVLFIPIMSFFHYATYKYITICDSRLGIGYYLTALLIIIFTLAEIFLSKGYLEVKSTFLKIY